MENEIEQKPSRQFNVIQAMYLSFFSKELYRDVGRLWKGVGFVYLLLLLALVWLPRAARVHQWVGSSIAKNVPVIIKAMPTFQINNGILAVDIKQPYILRDKDKIMMIVDTTGQYTSLDQVPKDQMGRDLMIILKDKALTRKDSFGGYEDHTFNYSWFGSHNVNREKLADWANLLAGWVGPLLYPFAVLGYFIFTILAVLVYALMGLGIAKILKTDLNYDASLRLSAVSHTPAILLATVFFISEVKVPGWFFVFFALSTFYLFLAVKFCAVAPPAAPETPVNKGDVVS
jgi:hypothetical protein